MQNDDDSKRLELLRLFTIVNIIKNLYKPATLQSITFNVIVLKLFDKCVQNFVKCKRLKQIISC